MEDVLQSGDRGWGGVRRAGSKVFFNRLLEENRVPVLWTANAVREFDPAFLRRMAFALEMPTPPAGVRARLWDELARQHGLSLPDGGAQRLARRHKVAPSLMVSATNAVATAGGNADEIDFVVEALARPLVGRRRTEAAAARRFRSGAGQCRRRSRRAGGGAGAARRSARRDTLPLRRRPAPARAPSRAGSPRAWDWTCC